MKIVPELLIKYNKIVEESGIVISKQNLESILSSYHYYESDIDKISSVCRGIVKNHAFIDGNKRVAALFLLRALKNFEKIDEDELADLILDIAENKHDVETISGKISKLTNYSGVNHIQ